MNDELRKTLTDFIAGKVCYLGSVDDAGYPNIKAMAPPRKPDGVKTFYISTSIEYMRSKQYMANKKACMYFTDNEKLITLMLVGEMEVLTDRESKQYIWEDGDEMFYPQGVDTPYYCVLKFTAKSGRYSEHLKNEDFKL